VQALGSSSSKRQQQLAVFTSVLALVANIGPSRPDASQSKALWDTRQCNSIKEGMM
jgi:hypothetical protein